MFKSRAEAETDREKLQWMMKCVQEQLGEREAAVERDEKDLKAKFARLNEMVNWIDAALRDSGATRTADILTAKLKGTWSAGEALK